MSGDLPLGLLPPPALVIGRWQVVSGAVNWSEGAVREPAFEPSAHGLLDPSFVDGGPEAPKLATNGLLGWLHSGCHPCLPGG
jgi:hypothetical protein